MHKIKRLKTQRAITECQLCWAWVHYPQHQPCWSSEYTTIIVIIAQGRGLTQFRDIKKLPASFLTWSRALNLRQSWMFLIFA